MEDEEESEQNGQDIVDKLQRELTKKGILLAVPLPLISSSPGRDLLGLSGEEYLAQCRTVVQDCWKLMAGKFLAVAENMLSAHVNPLMQIVYSSSPFRREAATIAVQAKTFQAILAMHRLDLAASELHYMEAVICARISSDARLLPGALLLLANIYTYGYSVVPRPDHAVLLFQEALQRLDGEEALLRGALHIGLAAALAQLGVSTLYRKSFFCHCNCSEMYVLVGMWCAWPRRTTYPLTHSPCCLFTMLL